MYSKGTIPADEGLAVGPYFSSYYKTSGVGADFNSLTKIAQGYSRAITSAGGFTTYMFLGSQQNSIFQMMSSVFAPEMVHRIDNQTWGAKGMAVDQKTRLLYPGERYLGMYDPQSTSDYTTGTVSVTNGSATVTGSGTTFVAGDVGKIFRLQSATVARDQLYLISGYVSATQITLSRAYTGTTASSQAYKINRAWLDTWKDFGTSLSTMTNTPIEVYEDTVLFGRMNNITSLNTLTDTITTDASPAFDMPSGYECFSIKANTSGILIAYNRLNRGTLVLWDNYSDRAIAPWINLPDRIIGMTQYGSGWLVLTAKTLYYTNGYGVEIKKTEFLGSTNQAFFGSNADNMLASGDTLFIGLNSNLTGRHAGVYRLDMTTGLSSYLGTPNGDMYNDTVSALFYDPNFTYIFGLSADHYCLFSPVGASSTQTYSYITTDVGEGSNMKVAEYIRLPFSIHPEYPYLRSYSFTITAKINKMSRQLYNWGQVNTGPTTTTIPFREDIYPVSEVGDEIEFLSGNAKGEIRHIASIANGGTSSAVYTLDTALPLAPASGDIVNISGFKVVSKQTINSTTKLTDSLFFNVRNKYKSKKFRIKFVITGLALPIILKPFQFAYDDLGPIE
jgi:hypothetical protein